MLKDKKYFLFDIDGTLAVDNTLFAGSLELIRKIDSLGGRCFYITNNSIKSRKDYVKNGLKGKDSFWLLINGECVERTYAVVVQYEKTSETVSHVLRQCVRSGVCRHHGEEQSRSRESRPFLRKHPDDATVRAFRVGEHPKK